MSELEDEIERLKSELEKARGHAAHLADALDWMERESGWVAKDTPLPTFVGNMRKELEAAVLERDNCKSIWMQGIKKVAATEKACAEMREAIELLWPHCDLKAFGGSKPRWLIRALSNECGKGYVHRDEVKPLMEALEWCRDHSGGYEATLCREALAHWRKEEGK